MDAADQRDGAEPSLVVTTDADRPLPAERIGRLTR